MFYSTHLVAGAAAGFVAQSPVKGFMLGVVTHIFLDMIPHHDHESVINCVIDITLGTATLIAAVMFFQPESRIIWGAIGGVLPDIEIPLYYFKLVKRRFFPSHCGWTPHLSTSKLRGILLQGLVIILGLWVLI